MSDDPVTINIQDRHARLRMARLENQMQQLVMDLQAVAGTMSTMANNLANLQTNPPMSGNCPKCNLWIDYTNPDMNATCANADCPCGLTESSHEISS